MLSLSGQLLASSLAEDDDHSSSTSKGRRLTGGADLQIVRELMAEREATARKMEEVRADREENFLLRCEELGDCSVLLRFLDRSVLLVHYVLCEV